MAPNDGLSEILGHIILSWPNKAKPGLFSLDSLFSLRTSGVLLINGPLIGTNGQRELSQFNFLAYSSFALRGFEVFNFNMSFCFGICLEKVNL